MSFQRAILEHNTRLGLKFNSCHNPAGPGGGQFCSGGSGRPSNSLRAAEWIDPPALKPNINVRDIDPAGTTALDLTNQELTLGIVFDLEELGKQKDLICTNLAEKTGFSYEEVNQAIHNWAESSNDTHYGSISMQRDAAELFGTELSAWQVEKLNKIENNFSDNFWKNLKLEEIPWKNKEDIAGQNKKFLKAMYEQTQADLKNRGVTEITLYRGIDLNSTSMFKPGEAIKLESNALESWSASPKVARSFGNLVIKAVVPADKILSTARTGFGCLNEAEFLIIGGKNDMALVARS